MNDYYGGTIKVLIGILLGITGYYLYSLINNNNIVVLLSERTNCKVNEYSILLEEKTLSVKTSQIESQKYESGYSNEVMLSFIGKVNPQGIVSYKIKAT